MWYQQSDHMTTDETDSTDLHGLRTCINVHSEFRNRRKRAMLVPNKTWDALPIDANEEKSLESDSKKGRKHHRSPTRR
jgi:hypothetical protein